MIDPQQIEVTKHMIWGRLIRELRTNLKLNQIQLSQRMGWPATNNIVPPIEKGVRALQATEIIDMAKALEVHPSHFVMLYMRRLKEVDLPPPPDLDDDSLLQVILE